MGLSELYDNKLQPETLFIYYNTKYLQLKVKHSQAIL